MPKRLDLADQTFGRWTVLAPAPSRGHESYWLCQCECGTVREVVSAGLRRGVSKSCGCYQREVVAAMNAIRKPPRFQCRNGHQMTTENTYIRPRGGQRCRICMVNKDRRRSSRRNLSKRKYARQYRRENVTKIRAQRCLKRQQWTSEEYDYSAEVTRDNYRKLAQMFPGNSGTSRTGKGYRPGWWTPTEDAIVLRGDINLREMCRLLELNGTPRSYRGVSGRRCKLLTGEHQRGTPLRGQHAPAQGMYNNSARLTDDNVRKIRSSDLSQHHLAEIYGVSQSSISLIKRRKTWTHVQ